MKMISCESRGRLRRWGEERVKQFFAHLPIYVAPRGIQCVPNGFQVFQQPLTRLGNAVERNQLDVFASGLRKIQTNVPLVVTLNSTSVSVLPSCRSDIRTSSG